MENKTEFLAKLFQLFLLHGAKSLTMDDIAKEFSVSKKTLYLHYKNKEELLLEVLTFVSSQILEEVNKVKIETDCAIESLLITNTRINAIIGENKNTFLLQLAKYYPEILHLHQKNVQNKIATIIKDNFVKGVSEGYFRNEINKELYAKFLLTLFFSVEISPIFEDENRDSICDEIIIFYLDAIVTEKGRKKLNELKIKYEKFS